MSCKTRGHSIDLTIDGLSGRTRAFSLRGPVTFRKLLEPGNYTLETFTVEKPHRVTRTNVVVVGGNPTILAPRED